MKTNIVITGCLIFILFNATAQKITYQILEDDPTVYSKFNLNLIYAGIDFSTKVIDASSFNIGLWGHYQLSTNKVKIDWVVQKSWFALGRLGDKNLPGVFELNLGGDYFFSSKVKHKNIKVVLKNEYSGTYYSFDKGNYVYDVTTTYISVPGKLQKNKGVRGGLYYKSNPYVYDGEDLTGILIDDLSGKMKSTGAYLGGIINTTKNLYIKTDQYGIQYNSISTDFYADLLILPANTFTSVADAKIDNDEQLIKDNLGTSPLGFRVGYKMYQIAPKEKTGKIYGMSFYMEGGRKPYLGWFFIGGLGITLIK